MLFYPENLEEKLEIDQVRLILKRYCKSQLAQERVDKAQPVVKFNQLQVYLDQTREMHKAISGGASLPGGQFEDIFPLLKRVKTGGTYLDASDFSILKSALETLYNWSQFLKKQNEDFPTLSRLTHGFIADLELVKEIDARIDERGEVRDNASEELSEIRNRIGKAERQVRKTIQKILEKSKKDESTEDDGAVTIRSGRLVIPVKSEYKRKLPGFVHDESSTGQTVFMEPTEVLDLNNEVRELQYRERREIIRILTALADQIRSHLPDLQKGAEFLVKMDFVHAKARFAIDFEALIPVVADQPEIQIKEGRHPLLWKKHQEQKRNVVPLNISLTRNERVMVISGPNAGGKSVSLKTVGMLQYMVQCGFPIPVHEESKMGFFRNYFADIGDSQSLENDLSTYSSHLTAMRYFTDFADKRTLVLIDEFGTGTEPQFGAAIAESILQNLARTGCFGVITTHYGNLKDFADKTEGLQNAAMRYDTEKLEPLFELEQGKPGSSFAFEIAQKMGLNKAILKEAKKIVGFDQVNYDRMLGKLDSEKAKFEKANRQLKGEKDELTGLRDDYEALRSQLDADRKKILKEAKQEALQLIAAANKQIERTIREIKEAKADKERTKVTRQSLEDYSSKIEEQVKKVPKKKVSKPKVTVEQGPIQGGDKVRLKDQGTIGDVVSVKGKQAEVIFGSLKSFVTLSKLEKISNRKAKTQQKATISNLNWDQKLISFSSELDVRGKRAEEVLPMVDRIVDDAIMLGAKQLRILHGKGHGILKDVIRNHLKGDRNILGMEDEHADRGGAGITIVTLLA